MPRNGFLLPGSWYRETIERAITDLEKVLGSLTESNAWLFVYCCVAWFEEVPRGSGQVYLHVNDRLRSAAGRELSVRVAEAVSKGLPVGVRLFDIVDQVGRAYDAERASQGFTSWQRNNVTGYAFEAALQVVIGRLTPETPSRSPLLNTLAGFELAPEGYHSRPDLVLFSPRDFRLLISTKWTLRKERLGTYLHEAFFYKRRRPDLQIAFVVAEFNLSILEWLCEDPLVDRVYHIGRDQMLEGHRPFLDIADAVYPISLLLDPNDRRSVRLARWMTLRRKLFDLRRLFDDIRVLRRSGQSIAVDPETAEPSDSREDDE